MPRWNQQSMQCRLELWHKKFNHLKYSWFLNWSRWLVWSCNSRRSWSSASMFSASRMLDKHRHFSMQPATHWMFMNRSTTSASCKSNLKLRLGCGPLSMNIRAYWSGIVTPMWHQELEPEILELDFLLLDVLGCHGYLKILALSWSILGSTMKVQENLEIQQIINFRALSQHQMWQTT